MGEAEEQHEAGSRPVAGPSLPPHLIAGTSGNISSKPTIGPTLPPHLRSGQEEEDGGAIADDTQGDGSLRPSSPPRKRVMGPALPPSMDEAEPKLSAAAQAFLDRERRMKEAAEREAAGLPPIEKQQQEQEMNASRPEWMMAPPTAQSFQETLQKDPTAALKERGFSQAQNARVQRGKGGAGMGGIGEEDTSLWTETPHEREKRLRDEELGIRPKAGNTNGGDIEDEEERERRRRDLEREARVREAIREHEAQRGPSLLEQHQSKRREELKGSRDKERSKDSKRRRDESDSDHRRSDKYRSSRGGERDEGRSRHKDRRHRRDSDSDLDSGEEARKRRHRDRDHSSMDKERDRHRHHHRSRHSSRSDDRDADEKKREKEKERERKQKRRDREREEKEEKRGAPMMVWDREAALSVGGKLLDDSKRLETIRSAAGLGSRFGSGSARYL